MAKISQYFKDKAKTIKDYPKTLMKAVYGDDGKRLDNIISDITSDIDSTKAKIGTTDISKYGDGTVTGAIKAACDKADANEAAIADVNSNLIKTTTTTITLGASNAGTHGYVSFQLPSEISSASRIVDVTFNTGQIAISRGMQLTLVNKGPTCYVNYYYPEGTTEAITYDVFIAYY